MVFRFTVSVAFARMCSFLKKTCSASGHRFNAVDVLHPVEADAIHSAVFTILL